MGKTPGGGRNLKNKTFLLNSRGLLSSLCSAEIPVARPRADTSKYCWVVVHVASGRASVKITNLLHLSPGVCFHHSVVRRFLWQDPGRTQDSSFVGMTERCLRGNDKRLMSARGLLLHRRSRADTKLPALRQAVPSTMNNTSAFFHEGENSKSFMLSCCSRYPSDKNLWPLNFNPGALLDSAD